MYLFFESICYENDAFQNLEMHQARIEKTLIANGMKPFFDLEKVLECSNLNAKFQPLKCRISYDDSAYFILFEPYKPKVHKKIKLVENLDFDYYFKFEDRKYFKKILAANPEFDDVITTQNGFLTDSTYANLAFFDGQSWFTPLNCLLKGTKRELLLEKKLISTAKIHQNDLSNFQSFSLINAMRDLDIKYPTKIIYQ